MAIDKHMLQTHSLFEKTGEVLEGVAKLKERIAELEKENHVQKIALEDAYRHVAMIPSIRRALWIARANFCARSCEFFSGIMSHCLIGQENLYERCEEKKNKYLNAMYKCRAKAEEYK